MCQSYKYMVFKVNDLGKKGVEKNCRESVKQVFFQKIWGLHQPLLNGFYYGFRF